MQRTTSTRRLALGITAGACTAVLALAAAAPAQASARAAAQSSQTFTVDYTHTTIPGNPQLGDQFVGNGTVTDSDGNQIGRAYDHCDEDAVTADSVTVECTSVIMLQDGEVDLATLAPIPDRQTAYPYTFEGVIQGGVGAYEGASGQAHITALEPGVYQVTLELQ